MKQTTSVSAITVDYAALTQKAKAEIIRLNEQAKSRNSNTETPEIYREWAYGVFLFWKKLAGENAMPRDVLQLEMLATGETSA